MARRPAKPAPKEQSETALQMQVVRFLRVSWPADLPFYHCPNGGKREHRETIGADGKVRRWSPEGGKLKAMGALAGVADLTFHLPKGRVGYIELKVGKNPLDDEQIKFRDACIQYGHGFRVARSVQEVEAILTEWLALFGMKLRGRLAA